MVTNYKIKEMNIKDDKNKKFLMLFTMYQILELLFCIIFDFCFFFYLNGDYFYASDVFSSIMEWTIGIIIQYFIALLFWWLNKNKSYRKIKITTYCCLDFMPKLVPCLIIHALSPEHMHGYDQWVIVFSLLIFSSKMYFWDFVASGYVSR